MVAMGAQMSFIAGIIHCFEPVSNPIASADYINNPVLSIIIDIIKI